MLYWRIVYLKETTTVYWKNTILFPQKPANILVMGEGPDEKSKNWYVVLISHSVALF